MNDLVIGYYGEQEFLPEFKSYSSKHNYNPILYNKREGSSPDPYFNCISLKNIGQHTHTYLHHVINNYNNLTDVTIFMLGSAFRDEKKGRKAHWLLNNANKCTGFMAQHIWKSLPEDWVFELPTYGIFDYSSTNISGDGKRLFTNMIRADVTPLGPWIEKHTNQKFENNSFYRSSKCMFAVHKNLILEHPLSYWEGLYGLLDIYDPDVRNLEVIHFFERAWLSLFVKSQSVNLLNQDISRYGHIR